MAEAQRMLRCPECGEQVTPPRVAWFGPGKWETHCPNGHPVVVENSFHPAGPDSRRSP